MTTILAVETRSITFFMRILLVNIAIFSQVHFGRRNVLPELSDHMDVDVG